MAQRYNYFTNTLGQLKDVMTNDAFIVIFANIPNTDGNSGELALRCTSVSLPGLQNQKVTVNIHGFEMNFRGKRSQGGGDMQLSFTEFADCRVSKVLTDWHEFVVGTDSGTSGAYKKGGEGSNNGYATTVDVIGFDTTGKEALHFICYNVFPTQVPGVQFNSESVAPMQLQATFTMDYYKQTLPLVQMR